MACGANALMASAAGTRMTLLRADPTATAQTARDLNAQVAGYGRTMLLLILAAGGARASEDAPPDLLGAEEQARAERVGLWGR